MNFWEFLIVARAWVAWGKGDYIIPLRQKTKSPKQVGKKEGGLGEGIFAHLPIQQSWTETADNSAKQKSKTEKFSFLFNELKIGARYK